MRIRNHVKVVALIWTMFLLASPTHIIAQEDTDDTPLGDVARSFRKKVLPPESVIDNDNLSKVVDEAESQRAAGSSPVFSLDPAAKSFRVSSPDVTCSLSFTAKNSSPLSDSLLLDDLPRSELAKLQGPATIDGDSLQVSMHNGTSWELREVVIGLTIVRRPELGESSSYHSEGRIIPAAGTQSEQDSFQKQPDLTLLLRAKGSAAPSATALFRTSLNFALFPDQEWHWAIVKAKGIPPQHAFPDPTLTQTVQPGRFQPEAAESGGQLPLTNPLSEMPGNGLPISNPITPEK